MGSSPSHRSCIFITKDEELGMVVPNGTLFAGGVGTRIKKELVENFTLHTIVRLPKGVFSPYTGIETNLLFFEKSGTTNEIWYYELLPPPERQEMKNPCYTKSKPLRYEEFVPLQKWWDHRVENEFAQKVPIENIVKSNYNLDIRNPNKAKTEEYGLPQDVIASLIAKEKRMLALADEIQKQTITKEEEPNQVDNQRR
jgi:type I restriction enzyme M protein